MKHLVLVGLMGAGKTTVGEACATRLGRPFVDTDDVVVALAGESIDEIFTARGEAAFREIERNAVADVCVSPDPLVVACGGGTVVDADNRKRLRDAGVVVWLRAPVDVLAARVGDGAARPLLAGDPRGTLARLGAAREAAYQAAAEVTVDTDGRSIAEVCDEVLGAFERALV
jgi:shikimate kinase